VLSSLEVGVNIINDDGDGVSQQRPGPTASSKCGARLRIHTLNSSSLPEIITTPPSVWNGRPDPHMRWVARPAERAEPPYGRSRP
jgi:hypothetical protein